MVISRSLVLAFVTSKLLRKQVANRDRKERQIIHFPSTFKDPVFFNCY